MDSDAADAEDSRQETPAFGYASNPRHERALFAIVAIT